MLYYNVYVLFSIAQESDRDKTVRRRKKGKKVLDGAAEMVYHSKSALLRRTMR